jgi:hypothetical protein
MKRILIMFYIMLSFTIVVGCSQDVSLEKEDSIDFITETYWIIKLAELNEGEDELMDQDQKDVDSYVFLYGEESEFYKTSTEKEKSLVKHALKAVELRNKNVIKVANKLLEEYREVVINKASAD